MKRLICYVICMLCLCGMKGKAQSDDSVERYSELYQKENAIRNNRGCWTFSLSGGITSYFGEGDRFSNRSMKNRLSAPYGKISAAKWFDSVVGLRLQLDGGQLDNQYIREHEPETNGRMYFQDAYVQVITNVLNWRKEKRAQRPVSLLLYGGPGVAWTPARDRVPQQWSFAGLLGLGLHIRLNDNWGISVEMDGTIVKDNFNNRVGDARYEGYWGGTAGLTYRIW